MSELPIGMLFGVLLLLLILSAFFSSSETGMMALNRYRLRHMVRQGQRSAKLANKLLATPDRLIGIILLGNNFVNIFASSVATVIAIRLMGQGGIALAAALLTLVVLIFAEVAPKTLAALYPERIALPAAYALAPLLKLLYPLVWLVNWVANGFLRLFGVSLHRGEDAHALSPEELRVAVHEAGSMIPQRHQKMLLGILDLEHMTIDDIMIPRNEIVGIDLEDDWGDIEAQLQDTEYSRLPVYEGDLDHIRGVVHVRTLMRRVLASGLNRDSVEKSLDEPYFIPEGTSLHTQLVNFQRRRARVGLVVDEYGDIRGLVTLADLLEEIVGEFTTDVTDDAERDVFPEEGGSCLVDCSATVRSLNRQVGWSLPTDGPKTLNGLILEHMETIPEVGTCFLIAGYPIEVVQTTAHAVKTVRVKPSLRRPVGGED